MSTGHNAGVEGVLGESGTNSVNDRLLLVKVTSEGLRWASPPFQSNRLSASTDYYVLLEFSSDIAFQQAEKAIEAIKSPSASFTLPAGIQTAERPKPFFSEYYDVFRASDHYKQHMDWTIQLLPSLPAHDVETLRSNVSISSHDIDQKNRLMEKVRARKFDVGYELGLPTQRIKLGEGLSGLLDGVSREGRHILVRIEERSRSSSDRSGATKRKELIEDIKTFLAKAERTTKDAEAQTNTEDWLINRP